MSRLPSIRRRLVRATLGWAVAWSLAVALAALLTVQREVDELLDDTLLAAAGVLVSLLPAGVDDGLAVIAPAQSAQPALPPVSPAAADDAAGRIRAEAAGARFAWQLVAADGRLLSRSPQAPAAVWRATPAPGFGRAREWRLYGQVLAGGRMLYVAQAQAERREAQLEVALGSAFASLAIALLGSLWLGARVRHELVPLQSLSDRLARLDPGHPGATLGAAEREELQPVHTAIDELGRRLERRLAHERAFAAHAAHALRTPLAGIDAQLAVLLRDSAPELQPRLKRVREAAGRLQRVVAALLALFRSGVEIRRSAVDLAALLARLPVDGVAVQVPPGSHIDADADLLAAALLNLLDNAQRHGATRMSLELPAPGTLRLHDDGPGVDAARREALQRAIDDPTDDAGTGLGLRLADLVARAHGGSVLLPAVAAGFAVELRLNDAG